MKLVYKAGDITEAHIVKGLLESNDIEAYVGGFYLQGGIGEIAVSDFANVQVADENYIRAREIINEYEGTNPRPSSEPKIRKLTFTSRLVFAITVVIIFITLFILIAS